LEDSEPARQSVDRVQIDVTRAESLRAKVFTYVGLLLPVVILLSFSTLMFISLLSPSLSAALAIDRALLFLVAVSLPAYSAGFILSVRSLLRSTMKLTAFTAVGLNVTMLALLLYWSRAFLMEFRFMGCQ